MRPIIRACVKRPCNHSTSQPSFSAQRALRFRSSTTTSSQPPSDTATAGPEAPPFHGYLIDALDAPLHTISPATSTRPAPPPPDEPPKTDEEAKLAKARVVFGSRLAGPAERKKEIERASTMVAGVMVPPRPEEPDNCCMSGCVNCVWDLYRDELEEWAERSKEARMKAEAQETASVDEDGGGREANWSAGAGEDGQDLFEGIPVGIREFMRTEKKLKARKRERSVTG